MLSGFGQSDRYVWATAKLHNNTDTVGQTATVSFNVLGAAGEILATTTQVEALSQPNADIILGTEAELPKAKKAAKVTATLVVDDNGTFTSDPFPAMKVGAVTVSQEYGSSEASFLLTNPISETYESPRIGVLCRDAAGKIVGGGVSFPDVLAAHQTIRVDASVTTTGKPKSCEATVGAPALWQGPSTPSTASASATAHRSPLA